MSPHRGNLSRRGFVQRSLGVMTAGAGLPLWFAREVFAQQEQEEKAAAKPNSANDKLRVGIIGTGDRLRSGDLLFALLANPAVEVVALADVDEKQLDYTARLCAGDKPAKKDQDKFRRPVLGAEIVKGTKPEPKKFKDFRDLVALKDVDAVLVITPDHWHALASIAAANAKKDIYCEKPLSLTIAEGRAMVNAARSNKIVFQTGSQQRSQLGKFRLACELVRNGRIGTLKSIETRIGNPSVSKTPFKTEAPPEGLDWDFWQGQTPMVDFINERCHYQFRWWYEYSGGKMTDWGAHHNDVAQWALAMDDSGPVSVEGKGVQPDVPNAYNCHHNFEVHYKYANGVPLVCKSEGDNGVRFEGDKGWIFVSRGGIQASDPKIIDEPLGQDAVRLYASANHMNNWLECIKSRQKPAADVEIGHRSATVCHLGTIAMRFFPGKTLTWDPATEKFAEAEANQHVSREMRAPWKL